MNFNGFQKQAILSAPGKVILCGEHAVVYGQDALAMAISLRCYSTIYSKIRINDEAAQVIFKGSINCTIRQKDLQLQIPQQYHDFIAHQKNKQSNTQQFTKILYKIGVFIKQTKLKFPDDKIYIIQISSDIPIGKCLGSSASFNTVLAGTLFIIMNGVKDQKYNLNLEQVNHLSKLFEKVEHGNPSGIDNYVATIGGLVLYNKTKNPPFSSINNPAIIKRLVDGIKLRLIDSGVQKNTKKAVNIVRQHTQQNEKFKLMIKKIGTFTKRIIQLLSEDQKDSQKQTNSQWKDEFFEIITQNHYLLKQLGVSIPQIQEIVTSNTIKGQRSAKITGAGMGGFVLVAENKGKQDEKYSPNQLLTKLEQKGLLIQYFEKD